MANESPELGCRRPVAAYGEAPGVSSISPLAMFGGLLGVLFTVPLRRFLALPLPLGWVAMKKLAPR